MKSIINWLVSNGWENSDACMFVRTREESTGYMNINGVETEITQKSTYGIEPYGDGWISGETGCEVLHYISFTKKMNGMLLVSFTVGVRDLDEFLESAVEAGSITKEEVCKPRK